MGCTNSSNVSGPDVVGTSKMHGDVYRYTIDEHEYIKWVMALHTLVLVRSARRSWKAPSVK